MDVICMNSWHFLCFRILYRNVTLAKYILRCWRTAVLSNGIAPVWLWISWANGTITIGTGNVRGMNLLLYYPENFLIANVSTVAVSSYYGYSAQWKIPYNQSAGKISWEVKLLVEFYVNLFTEDVFLFVLLLGLCHPQTSSPWFCSHDRKFCSTALDFVHQFSGYIVNMLVRWVLVPNGIFTRVQLFPTLAADFAFSHSLHNLNQPTSHSE